MQTSKSTLYGEAAVAAALVLAIAAVTSGAELGLASAYLHPAWIAVMVLAARYGPRGLHVSLIVVWLPLLVWSRVHSGTIDAFTTRLASSVDIPPMIAAVVIAWVAMAHNGRLLRLSTRLEHATRERERAEQWSEALEGGLVYLRSRCDRIDMSISLWRNVAEALERGTPAQASDAAVELCLIRSGGLAGCVQILGAMQDPPVVALRGHWSVDGHRPRDLRGDSTVDAAISSGRVQVASDVSGAAHGDADIAIPITCEQDDAILGVIALRGIDPARLRAAELRDLLIIADWLSQPLARATRKQPLRALPGSYAQ